MDEGVEGVEGFFDGGKGVEGVHMVDVDVVGAETFEAGVAGLKDVLARGAEVVGGVAQREKGFRGDEELVALAVDGFAEDLFGKAVGVAVGSVEEIDAGVEAEVDHAAGFVGLGRAPGFEEFVAAAEGCGAEAEGGDFESGAAEESVFHMTQGTRGQGLGCSGARVPSSGWSAEA